MEGGREGGGRESINSLLGRGLKHPFFFIGQLAMAAIFYDQIWEGIKGAGEGDRMGAIINRGKGKTQIDTWEFGRKKEDEKWEGRVKDETIGERNSGGGDFERMNG
jgi:hypothetical protein